MPSLRGIIAIAVPAVTALLGLFWYLGRKKATHKNPPDKSDPCVTKHLVKLPDPATVPCGKSDADSLRLQPNQVEEDKGLGFQDAEGDASLVSQDAADEILRDIENEVLSDLADEMKVIESQIIRPSFVVSSQTTFERQFQMETHETPEPSEPEQIEEEIGPKEAAGVSCVLPSHRDFQSQKCYSIENLEKSENYNASNNTSSSSTLQDNKSIEQLNSHNDAACVEQLNSQNDAACDESASKLWHENIPEDLTYTTLVANGIEQQSSEQSMHNEQNYVQDAEYPVCLSSSAGEGGVSDSQSNGCCSPSNGQNSASPIQKKDTKSDSSNNCDNFSEVSNDSGTGHSDHGNISPPDEDRLFEFNIPANMCGLLIGTRGNTVRDISQKSGTRFQVQNNPYNHKMKICVIEGTAVGIETACSIIKAKFPKLHFPSPDMAPSPKNPVLIPEIMQKNDLKTVSTTQIAMAGNVESNADILNDDMCRRALNRVHKDLVAYMDPDVVLDTMKNCGLLSQNEYDDLMNFSTQPMKIRTLVSKISQQDKKAYFDFKKCLSDTKHDDLVKKLDEKEKELITEDTRYRRLTDGRQHGLEQETARCIPEENSFLHDGRLVRLTMKMVDEFKNQNVSRRLDDKMTGSYGTIYISYNKVPWLDRRAVLKEINVADAQKTMKMGAARNELIASRLMHFAIVPLLAFHNDGSKYYLLTPYLENGDLHEAIKEDLKCMSKGDLTKLKMNCDTRVKIMYHIASAIDYMHTGNTFRRRILHQDIKSKNIVLDQHYNARLIDFGLAREMKENETSYKTTTSETVRTTQDDYCQFGEVLLELIVKEDYTSQNRALDIEYITEDLLLENIQEVWKTADIKDIVVIALKCLNKKPIDHSYSSNGLVTILKGKARKSSALWKPIGDKKCEICLVNDHLDSDVDCHDVDCPYQQDCSERIKICCTCMRNSYINPVRCHTCGEIIKPFINTDFGAVLVAGYEKPTDSVFKEDIIKFKEVVTSKVLPTMCLSPENVIIVAETAIAEKSPENVIIVAETAIAENNTAVKQLHEAFATLAKKKIKTLLFVYSGHKSEEQGFHIGKDEFFTIDNLRKTIETCKAHDDALKKVIVFLDCCYPEYVHLDQTLSLKLIQLNATGQSMEAYASIKGSQFLKYVMQAFTARANGGKCADLNCECGELLKRDFINLDDLRSYINTHIKSNRLTDTSSLHQKLHDVTEKDIILCFNYKHAVKFEFTLAWSGSLELSVTDVFPKEFNDDFALLKRALTVRFMERVSSITSSGKGCDIAATMCIETNTGPKEGDVEEINDLTEMLLAWNSKRLLRFKPRLLSNIEENKPVGWWIQKGVSASYPGRKIHLSQPTDLLKTELQNILTNNRLVKEDLRKHLESEVYVLIGKVRRNKLDGMCLEIAFLNLNKDVNVCYFKLVPTAGIQETM